MRWCVRAKSLQSCPTLRPSGLYVACQAPLSTGGRGPHSVVQHLVCARQSPGHENLLGTRDPCTLRLCQEGQTAMDMRKESVQW